ncbi:MAG: hypothetical protein Q9217_004284 [Psora testacea]
MTSLQGDLGLDLLWTNQKAGKHRPMKHGQTGSIDGKRLDPESLKDLYLKLLKEEAKIEAASRDGSLPKEINPRKRKLSSPPLETIDEASQYTYLLPNLIRRLYYQYRDEVIKSIEDEERRYLSLQKEVDGLVHSEKDARASRPGSQGVPPISALLRETENSAQPHRASSPGMVNGTTHRRASSETQATYQGPRDIHSEIYQPQSQPGSTENRPSFLPPPAHLGQGYSLTSPAMDRKNSSQNQGPSPSPRLNHAPLPPPERSSASPIILPPPKGMVRPSGSPPGPLDAFADVAGQQYRQTTSMPSPQQGHHPPSRQHPPARHHTQQQYPGYYDAQSYPSSYSPYNQSQVPIYHPHAGSMQPYRAPAQTAAHGSPYGAPAYQSPVPSQHAAYYPTPGPYQPPMQTPYPQQAPLYYDSRTPISSASARQRAGRPSPIVTSTSSTKWKTVDSSRFIQSPKSPVRPRSRDISPISDIEASPGVEERMKTERGGKATKMKQAQAQDRDHQMSANGRKTNRTQSRGADSRGLSGRAGSIGSSTVADSTGRSHSVLDDLSADQPCPSNRIKPEDDSASVTSLTADESSRATRRRRENLRSLDADPLRTSAKRKREENNFSATLTRREPQPKISPSSLLVNTPQRPNIATRPGHILATRNFPRISLPILNDISSHRLASLFAKSLTDRDAPGYRDMIYRPQDLKSIRAAINAGSKALTAAMDELGDSAGTGAHIWVPESEDLIPPKGIVNAGQLEKELMRMFANAVMFNPDVAENRGIGPAFRTRQRLREGKSHADETADGTSQTGGGDGPRFEIGVAAPVEGAVVKDTREVARDAQETFARWRAVERQGEDVAAPAAAIGTPRRLRGAEAEAEVGEGKEEEVEVKESVEKEENEDGKERRSKRRKR